MSIKWPNDLYWRDRKAGGILVENIFRGSTWEWSIVGIGLNINQVKFPENLTNPVSFRQITGKTFQVLELSKELCFHLQQTWEDLLTAGDEMLQTFGRGFIHRCRHPDRVARKRGSWRGPTSSAIPRPPPPFVRQFRSSSFPEHASP